MSVRLSQQFITLGLVKVLPMVGRRNGVRNEAVESHSAVGRAHTEGRFNQDLVSPERPQGVKDKGFAIKAVLNAGEKPRDLTRALAGRAGISREVRLYQDTRAVLFQSAEVQVISFDRGNESTEAAGLFPHTRRGAERQTRANDCTLVSPSLAMSVGAWFV